MANSLTQRQIVHAIDTEWLGLNCIYYPVVRSTNDILREMAERGEPDGTLVITDYQRKGKGRLGRSWLAPYGTSLLFSLLFRPDWPAAQANWLMMISALSCTEAISTTTGLVASLKWPNDIGLEKHGDWSKFGGILLEGGLTGDRLSHVVIGIGLNVNIAEQQLPEGYTPTTSLLVETGMPFSRVGLLMEILKNMERLYGRAESGHSPYKEWNDSLIGLNKAVSVSDPSSNRIIEGVSEGTDPAGRLMVRESSGKLHHFSAADVSLRS